MVNKNNDIETLKVIISEIKVVKSILKDVDFEIFSSSLLLQRASHMCMALIGDEVKNLSGDFRTSHNEISWRYITGFRDKIVHNHYNLDIMIVYIAITEKLDDLYSFTTQHIEKSNNGNNLGGLSFIVRKPN